MGTTRRIRAWFAALMAVGVTFAGCSSQPSSQETAYWNWLITDLLPISPGDAQSLFIAFSRVGYSGPIDLSATDVPAGISVVFDSNHVRGAGATGRVSVAASVAPSTYHLTLHGDAAGTPSKTANLAIVVGTAASYTLRASSSAVSVASGSSVADTINVNRGSGFTDDVFMSAIVPTGIIVDFAPSDVTGSSTVATIHTVTGLAAGYYQVVIHGIVAGTPDQLAPIVVTVR